MTVARRISGFVARWLDAVAAAIVGFVERFAARRAIRLVERSPGEFAVEAGRTDQPSAERVRIAAANDIAALSPDLRSKLHRGHAEIVLDPSRFVFRPLELPRRAAEFLDGIVRSQIDRITPWSASEAAFGWGKPADAGTDRIVVTVAATARTLIAPLVQALAVAGADTISVYTSLPEAGTPRIKVLEQKLRGVLDAGQVQRALAVVLVLTGVAAALALGAAGAAATILGDRQEELARQITARRAALRAQRESGTDPATLAQQTLERRKHETLPSVLVLETISRILPDHTYVTEFRIENGVMRISGFTRDAPSLIRLIEQSSKFSRATFFAPTTRAPSDPGERYHIEAKIEPNF
jgi:general secretion pathway protein L